MKTIKSLKKCPDCAAKAGTFHKVGCDVERCPECGGQFISCGCEIVNPANRIKWSGEWPNLAECREYDLWSKFVDGKGWVKCSKDDPDAGEDLNTLYAEYKWDKKLKKHIKKA